MQRRTGHKCTSQHIISHANKPTLSCASFTYTCLYNCLAFLLFALAATCTVLADTTQRKINLEITTHLGDKQTFVEGDTLSFYISLDQDAYLLVLYEDASKQVIQLLPNRHMQKQRYEAGLFIRIPELTSQHLFRIGPPFGTETVYAFASDKPFIELNGALLPNGLKHLGQDVQAVITQLNNNHSTKTSTMDTVSLVLQTKARQ